MTPGRSAWEITGAFLTYKDKTPIIVCRAPSSLWGLLWGCSLHFLVVFSEMLGNADENLPKFGPRNNSAKLATVSKLAQCMAARSSLPKWLALMKLPSC